GAGGQPGPIQSVDVTYVNFGALDVSGFDFDLSYPYQSKFRQWSPSLSVTEIYKYLAAIIPGSPQIDRVSRANTDAWAPRWKGTAALGWKLGPYSANVDARYVGRYQDYAPLSNGTVQTLGNFWLYDFNARYEVGKALAPAASYLAGSYFSVGVVNAF